MIRIHVLAALLLLLLTGAGCWDNRELETLAFVITMGVDKGSDGDIEVTMRIAIPATFAIRQGASAESLPETSKLITVKARSISEAISLVNNNVERRLDFRHLRLITFGEKLAQETLLPYLEVLARHPQFRRTIYLWMAKDGTARDVFLTTLPVLERSVSRYVEGIVRNADELGYSRMMTMNEFLVESEQYNTNAVLPMIDINEQVAKEKKNGIVKPRPTPDFRRDTEEKEEPGGKELEELARSGGNSSEFFGLAVFKEGKLIDKFSGLEARLYGLIRGTYRRGMWTFEDPEKEGVFSLEISQRDPPIVRVEDHNSDQPRVHVLLRLDGDVRDVTSENEFITADKLPEMEKKIAQEIEKQARAVIARAQEKHVDPFHLANAFRTSYQYVEDYEALQWQARHFPKATVHVTVDLKIRRPGLQIQPPKFVEKE
ncbi:Ger(x)C family spore germination protein [Heliobacterium undosum]|uniref:Ger(X)C family spore germination protein n=1 Tax=Heliomicrobium undosum TaxID=121734 RepID=A0A845L044_9FIRM|nr:Ger(x)C family spore germination protein [Heliomicrobium undosum]MZP29832.1 Ger(x)C family spore germination protein [Heliomicrobium undosum]